MGNVSHVRLHSAAASTRAETDTPGSIAGKQQSIKGENEAT